MPQTKKEWPRKDVESLITAYKSHECLWNLQNPSYRNKTQRKKAVTVLSEMFVTSEAEICRKLHNLRNQFGSELKKVKIKQVYDEEYASRWPYFALLEFIQPSWESGARCSLARGVHKSEVSSNTTDESEDQGIVDTIKIEENSESNIEEEAIWISNGEHSLKRVLSERSPDEIDTFALFVANEIRSLTSENLRKKLKRKIQRCILEVAEEEDL